MTQFTVLPADGIGGAKESLQPRCTPTVGLSCNRKRPKKQCVVKQQDATNGDHHNNVRYRAGTRPACEYLVSHSRHKFANLGGTRLEM